MGLAEIIPLEAQKIDETSAELQFMKQLCKGDADAAAHFFLETQQFGGLSYVDAPQGRYEGKDQILQFAKGWLKAFEASSAEVRPVTQTVGGGRSASEVIVHFEREKGDLDISMCIVGDLRKPDLLEAVRIYFYYGWVPGFSAYRRIIFQPEHQEAAPCVLMTGCVKKYFELLHGEDEPEKRVEDIIRICTEDVGYGGYRPDWVEPADSGADALRHHYTFICADAPQNYIVRMEAMTDDGTRCVVEWTLLVSKEGYAAGRVSQSGVAVYERDQESGLLRGIRICDNVGMEDAIRLEELPEEVRELVRAYREKKEK